MPPPSAIQQQERKPCARMALGYVHSSVPLPSSSSSSPSAVGTVPRKRRPRAVGEVFVSSTSTVYLYDPNDPLAKQSSGDGESVSPSNNTTTSPRHDDAQLCPVYENFATETGQRSFRAVSRSAVPVLPLTVVRVRQPERCVVNGEPPKPPEVPPRRKHAAARAAVVKPDAEESRSEESDRFELQSVSTFLGECVFLMFW